jgi:hypothetical protein
VRRSIDVRRPAVTLQVNSDHDPALRERFEIGTEHVDRAEAAAEQDQWPTGPPSPWIA